MSKRIGTLAAAALIGLALVVAAGAQTAEPRDQKTLAMTLEECILKAMTNNLALAVEVLNPEQSDLAVSLAREQFLPSLSFGYTKRSTASASYSFLDSEGTTTQARGDYSAQLSQTLPTGGTLLASLTSYNLDTNANFQTINPRYGTTLTFNFSHPLLKGFGPRIARRSIIVAQNSRDVTELQFNKFLQDKIYEVVQDYWNLVYAIENLKVQQQSLDLARELLEKNKRSVEIGTMAPMDVLSAEAEVAAREADILGGQALQKNSEDILRTVINLQGERPDAAEVRIVPSSSPASEETKVSQDTSLQLARDNRPDMASARLDIQSKQYELTYARNQLLPDLSLNAQYWSPGVSGTQVLYLNNNPLTGVVIGTVPGGSSASFTDTFGFKYQNWSVGLTLTLPLATVLSRAQTAEAKVSLNQSLLSLKNQEQQLELELSNAVRAVQTNYQRVKAYQLSRELAQRTLEAEQEKLKVGLSTNYFVLQYQRDLANQQSLELKAIIDYNLALANLEKAEGTSLKNKNIETTRWLGK